MFIKDGDTGENLFGKVTFPEVLKEMNVVPCCYNIHFYPVTTIISTQHLLSPGLVAQLVEQRTIKAGGRGFDFRRARRFFFLCLVQSPISLLGLTLSGKFMSSLTLTLKSLFFKSTRGEKRKHRVRPQNCFSVAVYF